MVDYTDPRWNEADSLNTAPSPNGIAIGSPPSSVPAVIRAGMGAQKRRANRDGYFAAVTNTGNDYSLTYDVSPLEYVRGENFGFFVNTTNTGAATLAINGLLPKALVQSDGVALKAGDLVAGTPVQVVYDGTRFRLVTPSTIPTALATTNATVALKANIASPEFTGVPTVPTPAPGTNTTQVVNAAFVAGALAPVQTQLNTHTHTVSQITDFTTTLNTALNTAVPAGAIMPFARDTSPSGWLVANGAAYSRTEYATLFAAIGTTYGSGNGSTTFNVPDLRAEFIRGWDNGRGIDPGRVFGSVQASQNLAHNHGVSDPGHAHTYTGGPANNERHVFESFSHPSPNAGYGTYGTGWAATGISIQSSGGTEARPRNIAMLYCIKA